MANGIEIIRARLLSFSQITDVVPDANIHPLDLPQGAPTPCILLGINTTVRQVALQGPVKQYMQRIAVEVTSQDKQQLLDIGDDLLEVLPCIKISLAGVTLVDIIHADVDGTDSSDNLLTFRRFQHYRVHWWN